MKIPQKLYFALNYKSQIIKGYGVVADKQHTKAYLNKKSRADNSAGTDSKELFLDNVPNYGFRVVDYDYEGLFWIEHPEGFNVSVTSRNMYDLMRTSTISNGEIQNKLYFDSDLNLISELSEILAANVEYEEKIKSQQKASKELKLNQKFKFDSSHNNNNDYVFISRVHIMKPSKDGGTVPAGASKLYYLYYDLTNKKYGYSETLDLVLQDEYETCSHFTSIEQALSEFEKYNIEKQLGIIAVRLKPIKYSDIKVRFKEVPLKDIVFLPSYPRISVIEEDGKYKAICCIKTLRNQVISFEAALKENHICIGTIDFKEEDGLLLLAQRRYWGFSSTGNTVIDVDKIENLKTGYIEYYL